MIGIALLQAAAIATASPRLLNSHSLFEIDDYPIEALRRHAYGNVSTELQVASNGKVTSCLITETSGSDALDAKTCAIIKSRAVFNPASSASGSPVAGTYRFATSWGIEEHQPSVSTTISLQVAHLPLDYLGPVDLQVVFGSDGHVTSCDVLNTSSSPASDRAACGYITREIVLPAPKSGAVGLPGIAVRYLTVSLAEAPAH